MALALLSALVLFATRSILHELFIHRRPSSIAAGSDDDDGPSSRLRYGYGYAPPGTSSNATTNNPFVRRFEETLLNDNLGDAPFEDMGQNRFVPLIFENGRLLCRRPHERQMSRYRTRFFVQMVRRGLLLSLRQKQNHTTSLDSVEGGVGLPILAMDDDSNGCNVRHHRDDIAFPRLAWSMLSPHHQHDGEQQQKQRWCGAVGMPSYETWKYYHRTHGEGMHWENSFRKNERRYPWSSKISKAVWRGSTTYEGSQYGDVGLGETPRGRLVDISSRHPELFDVAFHKIIQKFKSDRKELTGKFAVAPRMSPWDMMKYKAIIDIDGNNWSSRFGMLLCSNSVVVKIEPDFVEYFYTDGGDVRPMVHYVPATLENLTEAVAYVTDERNEVEMRAMVRAANSWCKGALSEAGMARDSILQLERYGAALDSYGVNNSWYDEWKRVRRRFDDTVDDLVDCNPWSIVDPFTFPMFAGL